jgi:hypothetical protein
LGTYVVANQPTLNFNAKLSLAVRTGGDGNCYAYLYFALPSAITAGATVSSAKLVLYTQAMSTAEDHILTARMLNQTVNYSTVTYNTRPTSLQSVNRSVTKNGVLVDKTKWEIDVTADMNSVAAGAKWYGYQLSVDDNVARWIYGDIHTSTAYRPALVLVWSDSPKKPTGLTPSGGLNVSVNKPLLKANFIDVSGDTSLDSVQVQLSSSTSFTTPVFDSGVVPAVAAEYDLSTSAYGGLADGATIYWRIQFWDGAGLPSGWSDTASFKRDAKGTLTITNPPSGTPVVEDVTPPIIWTFTGETQTHYQDIIQHTENGVLVTDWNSGKIAGTVTTVTVPAGKITDPGATYTLIHRVWDSKQRVATPGDPVYTEATRDFTFVPGATVGVTDLVVTTPGPEPRAKLAWTRATAPDWFNIYRNGKVLKAKVLPEDVLVSGTSYEYYDGFHPDPYRPIEYKVQAVVNNIASATNNTVSATLTSRGTWLRPEGTSDWLFIAGREDRNFKINHQTAVLESLDGRKTVVTQALGGFEGTISGQLINFNGKTAQEWRDIYIDFAKKGGRFWLTTGEYTMLVAVIFGDYSQRTIPVPVFDISFDFYQQENLNSLELGYEN